ncbi:MAG: hypothetical protein OER43_02455 [Gammaproteobacteria bacterium]|nr:hypothetical protein [Gammaproteobacteria bacterium]MDH3412733.1 hypothetical protein [Gammaproteobacteria bacterium]
MSSNLSQLLKEPGTSIEAEDDFDAVNELVRGRGWGDGLPVLPPTAARVEQMLQYCDRPWDEPIALIAPRYGAATPLRLSANAVMAGCRPEYFPLLMLAVEAMCEEPFNCYGIQATTHQCGVLVLVNGPVAKELDINAGHNAFGPGRQANATIGRALRFAQVNIGGAIPGLGDMSTFGSPAKYTYCAAENEDESPWEPLHVERGYPREASTVTVFAAEGPHNVNDHESLTGEGILKMVVGTVAITGANNIWFDGEILVIFGPEHAATVAKGGFTKNDVKKYIFEHARLPLSAFSQENIERRLRQWPVFEGRFAEAGMDALVPVAKHPEEVLIAVVGGAGKHSAYIPTFGASRAITRPLKLSDGQLARSVEDFGRR